MQRRVEDLLRAVDLNAEVAYKTGVAWPKMARK